LNATERLEYDAVVRDAETARWFLFVLAEYLNRRVDPVGRG
jgi:hypothetical protein